MTAKPAPCADTILILGGAGMVGVQVAREAIRVLRPRTVVLSALTQREVDVGPTDVCHLAQRLIRL